MSNKPEFEYVTPEDFARMALPVKFDTDRVKNKVLDVQYGTLPEQKLDIYLPDEAKAPFPVIFYVHGGGWYLGNKLEGALDCIIDAIKHGYAVISVDYRLAPGVSYPEFIYDVKTAVRWARAHAAEYGIDPDHFGMIGDSAGGHITLTMGFTGDWVEYEGKEFGWADQSSKLQAICDMYGPSILFADEDEWYRQSKVRRMATAPVAEGEEAPPTMYDLAFGTRNKNLLRVISPYSMVHKDIPPTMIQQGLADAVVPYQHSTLLAERITEVCGADRVHLCTYPERNHSDKDFMTYENCKEVLEFFDKYLK
ncbi:MAG: alpha/beta hydrolase [Oscillospiraceae bacterium]|nr:alpha/beta hydrolase [Oscillospiraceae bacterium]